MRIQKIALFCIPIFLIFFFWRNTIFHISTHLHDWYDGAFIIWTMQNNIKHFVSFDFRNLFETNAMYPFSNSLSFTDHLFVPSFFALVISFFNKNPLFQFNVIWIFNHILVFFSWYLLTGRFTKNSWVKLITALYGSFGPYFFSQFGHLQMVFMWPLLVGLYYLLDPWNTKKQYVLSGVFIGLQFLTSVYLGLMGMVMVSLYFGVHLFTQIQISKSKFQIKNTMLFQKIIKDFFLVISVFTVVASPSIYGYMKVNMQYKPVREQSEFVTYSAHVTDYAVRMFSPSLFNQYIFAPAIGKLNHHQIGELAGFVGFIPLAAILVWVLRTRNKKNKEDKVNSALTLWLVLLLGLGFLFSLGPRANWNGSYLVTPLPYWLVMKVFPPVAIMRAVSRWYFLVVFAVTVFFAISLNKLIKKNAIAIIIFVLFLFEFYPSPVAVSIRNWASPSYLYLQNVCKEKSGAVLEYPFEYRYKSDDIGKYLSLKTNTLMSSTLHDCPTLSGFSSFEPPLFKQWQKEFDENGITDTNLGILKKNRFRYIRMNMDALSTEEKMNPNMLIHTKQIQELFRDNNSILYEIIYE